MRRYLHKNSSPTLLLFLVRAKTWAKSAVEQIERILFEQNRLNPGNRSYLLLWLEGVDPLHSRSL